MNPKIYVAARYKRKAEASLVADELRREGFVITSRWLGNADNEEDEPGTPDEWAASDLEDVLRADAIVSLSESRENAPKGASTGGRHVEFGIAISRGLACIVIGPRENVFHHLPHAVHFDDSISAINWMCENREHLVRPSLAKIMDDVRDEFHRATAKFGAFASTHEGYAIILEELDELWDEVKLNSCSEAMRGEAIQVAAMAIRFIHDICPPLTDEDE